MSAHPCSATLRTHLTNMRSVARVVSLCALLLALRTLAQDTRVITEPRIPPACAILTAQLASIPMASSTAASPAKTLAEADESRPDTQRIQAAMDRCAPGRAVELKPASGRDAFLTGPLELRSGVTLLIDRGVTLFGSRNPRDYDVRPGLCGTITEKRYPYTQGLSGHGCKPLIGGHGIANAAIMGDGTIDGRRNARLLGQSITWEDLAEQSIQGWPEEYTRWARGVGKVPQTIAPPKFVGLQNNPRSITFVDSDNITLYRIRLQNSPNFAVSYAGGDGFTVWGITIYNARDALNGDGIDIGQPWPEATRPTADVTVTHSWIYAGDDNLAIKSRTGSPTTRVSVLHNHFYAGHGIGTGSSTSGGIAHIRVQDLTLDGTSTGINMKSNNKLGGLVTDVDFDDICIRGSGSPISISTHSSSTGHHEVDATEANKPPQYTDIRLRNLWIEGPGRVLVDGLDADHPLGLSFRNVLASQPAAIQTRADHANLTLDATNLLFSGEDVQVTGAPGPGTPGTCAARFLPFPGATDR